jgi:hypothetical protein
VIVIGFSLAGITASQSMPLADTVAVLAFPLDAIAAIGGAKTSDPGVPAALAIVLFQFVAWTSVGFVGLKNTERTLQS